MFHTSLPLFLGALLALSGLPAPVQEKKEPALLTEDETKLLDLINKERAKENLPALKVNAKLQSAARGHSENMAKQDKTEHVLDGKGPGKRVDAAGYDFSLVGENIFYDEGVDLETMVKEWMGSPPHRANIMKKEFTETGLAIVVKGKNLRYTTQVFAKPAR